MERVICQSSDILGFGAVPTCTLVTGNCAPENLKLHRYQKENFKYCFIMVLVPRKLKRFSPF